MKTKIHFTFDFPIDSCFALNKCMKPGVSSTAYSSEQTTCRVTGDCLLKIVTLQRTTENELLIEAY